MGVGVGVRGAWFSISAVHLRFWVIIGSISVLMDSAPASYPIASTDVLLLEAVAEDDGSLPVTAGLAKEAAVFFQAGNLVDCLGFLNQLLQKREDDPKLGFLLVYIFQISNLTGFNYVLGEN